MEHRADSPAVAYARELEAADERVAAAIARVGELQELVESLRLRGRELETFLDRVPLAREAAGAAVADAELELAERRAAVGPAEERLAEAERRQEAEELAAARRAATRARDAVSASSARLERAEQARAALEREAQAADEDVPRLEASARELALALEALPRVSRASAEQPRPGLRGTIAWAAKARAALFVVRGGLDAERERLVRQANELGASVLGDTAAATSVALVRERLERRPS